MLRGIKIIVRELLTRLGYAVNETQLTRYQNATNNIRNAADGAADAFRNMFLGFVGFSAIKSIAKTADDMQSLEARIGMLPQTLTTAGEAFEAVAQRASDARQGIEGYASFYIKAGNATQDFIKDQEELLKVVDGAAIALAASGSDATRQKEAFFQLGQAIGSPTIQMEEMNTIIDVAPDLFRALGKAIPGANGNLKAFVSTGKVTGEMLAKGLMAILPQFVEQMKNMPMTIGTAAVLIGNRWSRFIAKLNRESSAVTTIAEFLLKGFDMIENGLKNMVDFFGGATNTLKAFGIALAAILTPLAAKLFVGAIQTILSPIGLLVIALGLAGVAIDDFYGWMSGADSVFGDWFGNFDDAMKKLDEFSGWITAIKIAVASAVGVMVANWIWGAGVAIWSAGVTTFAWLTGLAKFGAAMVANAAAVVVWVASLLASLATLVAGWVSSFIAMDFAALPVSVLILGIVAAIAALIAIIYLLLRYWKDIFGFIEKIAIAAWDGIAAGFFKMVDGFKKAWTAFKNFFTIEDSPDFYGRYSGSKSTSVSAATAAGAASSTSGVPGAQNTPVSVVVNQTLPPGTPAETASAAQQSVTQAFNAIPADRLARQLGQVGG